MAALLVALVALALVRSAAGTRLDSFMIDEPWHIVAGVSYVRHGDFALNPEHPPLVKLWTGALIGESFHVPPTPVLSEKSGEREWTADTMYRDNDDRAAQARARMAMWAFHALLLLTLSALLWRAFGPVWAAATVAFLAVEPTVGAHLPLVMTDLPVALALSIAALCLGLLVATWTSGWAVALAVALGAALGSKHSALAGLAGLALFGGFGWLWSSRSEGARALPGKAARLAVAALLGLAVLWAQYGMRFHARPDGSDGFNRPMSAKVGDLRMPLWRAGIHAADSARVVPRAYLWGLADTVRAGIEGRGAGASLVWGRSFQGNPPWYVWPSLIISKIPLALLAMSILGVLALWRTRLSRDARWCLGAMLAMAATHLASLMGSQTAYAGVRHALPVVLALAVLAGAFVSRMWATRRPAWRVTAALPLLAALAMTFGEPRLWEYHNELAGGSQGAYRQFRNEGLDVGQRFHEVRGYYDAVIAPTGEPLHFRGFHSPAQVKAAGIRVGRRAATLEEETTGIDEGWFMIPVNLRLPWPHRGWDPAVDMRGLTWMARFGAVEVWRGRQEMRPSARVGVLYRRILNHVHKRDGQDWPLVARRTREVLAVSPHHVGAGVELGNAHLRMGNRSEARAAYQALLDQTIRPVDALTRASLVTQIASIDAATDLSLVAPLRHSWME